MHRCLFTVCVTLCGISSAKECALSDVPPDPKSGCCGLANGSSLRKNTSIAEIDEYPWMALVEHRTHFSCSAILISGRYVMSAAQCFERLVDPSNGTVTVPINIRLGDYETSNEGKDCVEVKPGQKICNNGAISIPIEKVTLHPNYEFHENDIALIRMRITVPYTDFIRPICLLSFDITIHPPRNLYMTVAGWGAINTTVSKSSNVLRRVDVPFVDAQKCENIRKSFRKLTNNHICAGSKNRDFCKGDAGSPLMYFNRKTMEVAGIVSRGPIPCGRGIPSVYTKVFPYKDWIHSVIKEDSKTNSPTSTTTDSGIIVFRY